MPRAPECTIEGLQEHERQLWGQAGPPPPTNFDAIRGNTVVDPKKVIRPNRGLLVGGPCPLDELPRPTASLSATYWAVMDTLRWSDGQQGRGKEWNAAHEVELALKQFVTGILGIGHHGPDGFRVGFIDPKRFHQFFEDEENAVHWDTPYTWVKE